jgi:hypothetical protein
MLELVSGLQHRLAVTTKRRRFLVTEKLHRHGRRIGSCPLLGTSGHHDPDTRAFTHQTTPPSNKIPSELKPNRNAKQPRAAAPP